VARRVAGLPWVERATASRQWLGTVRITVVERTAVAVVAGPDNGWALVDLRGHVVDISGIRPIELPVIEGVEPAGPRGSIVSARSQAALQVAAALPPDLKTRTDAVVAAGEETQLRLVPTGTVRLGDESRLPDKLQAVLTVLGSVDPKVVKVLDVRVPRAPVLTRR
jgi:cell division protein FtsQ